MFKGIRETSFVDYPGKISTVLFTGGCDFRCAWCHNRSLVLPELVSKLPEIPESEIKRIISERKDFIQGVCITGGEPSLWGESLNPVMAWIRSLGLKVKVDTNGASPDVLSRWYDAGLVDFTAMDIKNSISRYARTVGVEGFDTAAVERSIRLIRERSPAFQFRITQVPDLVSDGDIRWIEEHFGVTLTVQPYRPVAGDTQFL
jgi:pyruvate formate lyase activating enzyme